MVVTEEEIGRGGAIFLAAALWLMATAGLRSQATAQERKGSDTDLAARVIAAHATPSSDAERRRTPLPADPQRVLHFVRPKDTDATIDRFLKDHIALFRKDVRPNGKLFLFFPGTYGRPAGNQLLLDGAARAGYHVLGLEYVNTTDQPGSSVNELCLRDPDPDCAEKVRRERVTGEDASAKVDVSPANSILNRTDKALAYLARQYPGEGWDAFRKNGHLDWTKVAVGGHSQGAGMAVFIAKRYPVARVCLFSGGGDYHLPTQQFAPWLAKEGVTPAERYYGLVHEKESAAKGFLGVYAVLGLTRFGDPLKLRTDGTVPSGAAHILVVSFEPNSAAQRPALGGAYHNSTAVDLATPRDQDGRPRYRQAWRFVLGG